MAVFFPTRAVLVLPAALTWAGNQIPEEPRASNLVEERLIENAEGSTHKSNVNAHAAKWLMNLESEEKPVMVPVVPSESLQKRLRAMGAVWKRDTRLLSSSSRIASHPAYRAIIQVGWAAVPFMLSELRREPDHWFMALRMITGADPVPIRDRGNVRAMARAWVDWGRAAGVKF